MVRNCEPKHAVIALALCAAGCAAARVWTDQQGREREADLVRVEGTTAVLGRNGREYRVPLTSLSTADQAYAAAWHPPAPLLQIAGQTLERGVTNTLVIPLPAKQRALAAKGFPGNPGENKGISNALVCFALPAGFDPGASNRVFVVGSTDDPPGSSILHMKRYLKAVTDLGWVIIAADAEHGQPTNDHIGVRWALISAGLDAMHDAWPASRKWDYVAGGFSGGAKKSAYIGGLLLKDGYRLRGMYMGGCNEDRATRAAEAFRPPSSYKAALNWFME